jgi:rSAM/selenodomain-associated transferase 2
MRVSVIVPTLNEEAVLGKTLDDLRARGVDELIVVDGGSGDGTEAIARKGATAVLLEPGGLVRQLQRGGAAATGDVLLFHHADLRLPPAALEAIRRSLLRPEVLGGAFRLGFDSRRPIFALIAFGANLRNRLGFGPFGDQAIFIRREAFARLGGFREGAGFEDLDLVKRMRRAGRFVILPGAVRSSPRRYERDGVLRTLFRHLRSSALHVIGARRRARNLRHWLLWGRGTTQKMGERGGSQNPGRDVESN